MIFRAIGVIEKEPHPIYLKETLAGKKWAVSNLLQSKLTKEPIIAICRRIENPKSELSGIIIAAIYPDKLGKLLDTEGDRGRIISVFDRDGRAVIQYPAENWNWRQRSAFRNLPAVRDALAGEEITTIVPDFLDGKERLAAMTPVELNGWVVCTSRPVQEVFRPIIRRSVREAGMFTILVIFVFAVAMFVSQRMVSPLKKLHEHALKLGQGSGYPKLDISRHDRELQDLVSAFNKMTEEIAGREKALEESRARFIALLEAIPAFVCLQAPNYAITYANRTFRESFGDPEGKPCYEVLRGEKHPCTDCTVNNPRDFRMAQDWKWTSPGGRIYRVYDRPFDFDGASLVLKMGVDITEQETASKALVRSEKRLKRLSSRLFSAQEEERKRIAGEIHDSIGQTLVAMKFITEKGLLTGRKNPDEAFRTIEAILPFIENAIQEVRSIHTGLRPPVLDKRGIIAAMTWFCENFQTVYPTHRLETSFEIEEQEIAEELKIIIFRVSQEALNNIAKYSRAEKVRLSLSKKDGSIRLDINDNGVGFDLQNHRKGLGLTSMRERVELSGGSFVIESGIGRGTAIKAEWPMA